MEKEQTYRPVPAPRRLNADIRKTDYENVTVDLINKNLNINIENIHNNNINCTDKIPNNKVLLGTFPDTTEVVNKPNTRNSIEATTTIITTQTTTSKSILTETNDLYGPNANEIVPDIEPTREIPTTPASTENSPSPAPRPRKELNNEIHEDSSEIYENTKFDIPSTLSRTKISQLSTHSTGAISKDATTTTITAAANGSPNLRKAPKLPARNSDKSRHSISSEFSTTSSYNVTGSCMDLNDNHFSNSKLPKSASNATLNSSLADSTEGSENSSKFKSPSPGDLLRSLGTTSKLLTESIGERVALKAKGAKHKLDKNLKTSKELLSDFSQETSTRLKRVGKHFGTNFSIVKKDSNKDKEDMSTQFHADRPQTLPPNDQVFNQISFSSPLQRKANGVVDLSVNEIDGSYEIPKTLRTTCSDNDLGELPSYEDALKAASQSPTTFPRNPKHNKPVGSPNQTVLTKSEPDIQRKAPKIPTKGMNASVRRETPVDISRNPSKSPSPPMPSFPPPSLPQNVDVETEGLYGKINPVKAPVRLKRRKNYEQIQLRRPLVQQKSDECLPAADGISLRANVDSAELHQLNLEAVAAEREESMLLRERIEVEEAQTPKPDRSDSWEYYEENEEGDDSDGRCSSPEPLYANHEATYGRVFEMASSKDLVPNQPNVGLHSIREECPDESEVGAVGGELAAPPKEIIQEFDPLVSRRNSTLMRSNKSNELLLLEHLLESDVYCAVQVNQAKSDDDISMCTSEEDNNVSGNGASGSSPKTSPPTIVLPLPSTTIDRPKSPKSPTSAKDVQIVHQNAQLLSDSMENMLDDDEERLRPYLSRVEENSKDSGKVDLSKPNQNRTNWFVDDGKEGETATTSNGHQLPFNPINIDGESPPSYLEAIGADGKPTTMPNESKSRASRFMNSMNVFSNVKMRVDALKRKSSFKAAQRPAEVKITLKMIPRPSLSPLLVRHEGPLIRFPSGVVEDILKEMQNRKAILRDRQFQTFLDQEMKTPKETIPLECVTTIQCVSNNRVTDNNIQFYCFEITTATPKNGSSSNVQSMSNPNLVMTSTSSGNCKHQRVAHLYGVSKESERGIWMQKILESLTNTIPPKYVCHYYRAGWCYLKNSITSEWSGTWLVLRKTQRRLVFVSEATMNVEKMDLRKARCIVLKDSDDSIRNLHVESGPSLMIDCPPFTVYMIMSTPRETKVWRHIIREVAHNNGFSLADQQLTKFNVPVIVDKCINFVYIHGSMSEGIYRKSGSENSITKLLTAFRADAFNAEITRNEYNEHDVANVLKRFMRDLPEKLLGKYSDGFMCITELKSSAEKIPFYKELLARLSVIERETLKKIIGHLAFISSQKCKNKMSIQNLTMIWGPTLLKGHQAEEAVYSQKESDVLKDLIVLHKNLFPLTPDEIKKEQEMLMCLQKYYASAETLTDSVKKSGDLKMWITINPNPENTTEEKTQVNVTITPTKTAYEICKELAPKMNMAMHQISLHEIILNDNLERPLHHETKVFDVVLNWSYWPENDRKNNYLVVKPIDFLREVQRAVKNLATVTPGKELKFADSRTKSFKSYQCELRDGKIVVSKKDKNDKTTIVREIFLHSTTAYLGCEKKRDFPWSWAITFVEKTQTQILRSRDSPYIGHVLAGSEWVDRTIWYSSIWYCIYGDSILPPAEIIIK